MKKFFAFLLLFLMVSSVYAEKLALYEELSDFFDNTFVLKPGIYEVGKDIKIGTYRFMYNPSAFAFSRVRIGSEINVSKTDLLYDRQHFDLYNPYSNSYWFQTTEAYYRLKKGDYLVVEISDIRMEPSDRELSW